MNRTTTEAARGLMNHADFMPQRRTIIPTHRPWWECLWRDLYSRYLRWCETSVREEREAYEEAGINMGPEYVRNSYAQEELLRVRIADVENG